MGSNGLRKKEVGALLACAILAWAQPSAKADTIVLNDGRKIEGIVTEESTDFYNIKIKIGAVKIKKETVKEIKRLSAEENCLNLGDQYLASGNLDAALEQYNKALEANPYSQAAKDSIAKIEELKAEAEAEKKTRLEQKEKDAAQKKEKIERGFGFKLETADGRLTVKEVIAGNAGEAVGIRAKDEIVQIDNTQTKGKSLEEITDYLTKPENVTYAFLIQRENELTRKKIGYQKGSFVGVGIFLEASDDLLTVNSVMIGEPADLAGIKSKDRVVSIDGKKTAGMSVDDAAALISGTESSKVKVTIQRPVELERK